MSVLCDVLGQVVDDFMAREREFVEARESGSWMPSFLRVTLDTPKFTELWNEKDSLRYDADSKSYRRKGGTVVNPLSETEILMMPRSLSLYAPYPLSKYRSSVGVIHNVTVVQAPNPDLSISQRLQQSLDGAAASAGCQCYDCCAERARISGEVPELVPAPSAPMPGPPLRPTWEARNISRFTAEDGLGGIAQWIVSPTPLQGR